MIATLRQRDFRLAWLGGLISMMGDWVLFIALPIYIYQLTDSTLATSGMFVAGLLPALLLGSVAGVFVDRWDRKRTMIVCNLILAVILLPLLALRSADWVWIAYVVSFVRSVVSLFFRPAENAFLPRLVAEEDLLAANSLNAF
ncbi:MAG TPA: MFS transporter, partial [Thermomicrobiales bacterium]|nr:MFS transporter [Thermomicrobiales bacterium]